ncbi:MAG: cobalamin biosynthesis protein CbiD [Atopobiaceae bacterium]|nr:cobalamin biosynthesis protein CbiD [Atopobiaceae bacterium]
MRKLDEYISTQGKLLRCGYTTGTCAAAGTRAATDLLLGGSAPATLSVDTPSGIRVELDVEEASHGDGWAQCAVRKDAGDDPDVTDGVLVRARVSLRTHRGIHIDGGAGVGHVTKEGLDQPPGSAAINTIPRSMIEREARRAASEHDYDGGLNIRISIPGGEELAAHTFNPRLGIEGGLSVLGTTGIVRPMSEAALVESLQLELRVAYAQGTTETLLVPGNYGKAFAQTELGIPAERAVTCSNYVGAALDEAARLGFEAVLLVGHVGKLVKVAAGAMNTHSRMADGRAETVAAHAALAGATHGVIEAIFEAPTTEAMLDLLCQEGLLEPTMASLAHKLSEHLRFRAGNNMRVEAIMFSNKHGLLCGTAGADKLVERLARPAGASSIEEQSNPRGQ